MPDNIVSVQGKLRIVFMGTPKFALQILEAVIREGHNIQAVYSQPSRSSGRGKKVKQTIIGDFALENGFKLITPKTLKDAVVAEKIAIIDPEVIIVAAYGLILPRAILEIPRFGCLNVHASLLPRWRGAAPVQRAILAGDVETGVTIMKMEEGLDTGPILMEERISISDRETSGSLEQRLGQIGGKLITKTLSNIEETTIASRPQPQVGITYAEKIEKSEGQVDWALSAEELDRKIRAFQPSPGAWFIFNGERIKILDAIAVAGSSSPGRLVEGLVVGCGKGLLDIKVVQRQGKKPMSATDFLNGFRISPGTVFN